MRFYDQFMYTVYTMQSIAHLEKDLNAKPIKTVSTLHSQFMLKYNTYRDQNTFLKVTTVELDDNRWSVFDDQITFKYIDVSKNEVWMATANYWQTPNATFDLGKTWIENQEDQTMVGLYFFMSEYKTTRSRHVQTVL